MAVNGVPRPRSFPQILGQIINTVTSKLGIRRLKVGGGVLSIAEAAAQSDVRNSQDIFELLQSKDLDNTTGQALDRIGRDERVPRFLPQKATGAVTISDTSFEKISTKVYQGTGAPIVGSVTVNVEDAEAFPSSGQVYLGRLTPRLEGPIAYSSKTDNGAYWTLNLSTPTTQFHNKGESVVLAQGGVRNIDAGYAVATAQGSLTTAVQFTTLFAKEIPDGEVEVQDVQVVAVVAGASGNAEFDSVTVFPAGEPFPGAAVTNPQPYIDGRDTELDDPYRERIRDARASRSKGTDLALTTTVLGITATDGTEAKRCTSASLVRRRGEPSILFIDDGSGYEEKTAGVGIEVLAELTSGGERDFKTLNRPVAKAHLVSANRAPFVLVDSAQVSFRVGGVIYTHTFDASEFRTIGAASGYEVVASVNRDPDIAFGMRTLDGGLTLVAFARAEEAEDIEWLPVEAPNIEANEVFQFPAGRRYTSLLYRDDRLLTKDGSAAQLRSRSFAQWTSFTGDQTLEISVDQTPFVTYTFTDDDFVDAGTSYTGVGKNSTAAWVAVINRKIPGVTASVELDKVLLTSNRDRTADAALAISGGSLVGAFVFDTGVAAGTARDYTLDRATGDISLVGTAGPDERYTLGSLWTRGFSETDSIPVTALAADAHLWVVADGSVEVIPNGVGTASELIVDFDCILPGQNQLNFRVDNGDHIFDNVERGDWMLVWDPAAPAWLKTSRRVVRRIDNFEPGNSSQIILDKEYAEVPRTSFAAVALPLGSNDTAPILVCGGATACSQAAATGTIPPRGRAVTEHCEVLSIDDGTWTTVAHMTTPRQRHTATLLGNGKVLVTGGCDGNGDGLASTELYDPVADTWTAGPAMSVTRADHTATLLSTGNVLIVGGWDGSDPVTATDTAQEYNPGSNTFVFPTTMSIERYGHGAARLSAISTQANKVLVVCGIDAGFARLASMEMYDPVAHTWTARTSTDAARAFMGWVAVEDNKVVLIGDADRTSGALESDTFARYNVTANTWVASAQISTVGADTILYSDKQLGVTEDATNFLAPCCLLTTPTETKMVHLAWSNFSNTWGRVGDDDLWRFGAERARCVCVPLVTSGGSSGKIYVHGGTSISNAAGDSAWGPTCATGAVYDAGGDTEWFIPDEAGTEVISPLTSRGVVFARTLDRIQMATIPAAGGYAAGSIADALNADLDGVTADVYRTSRLRLSTNTFSEVDGELALLAVDSDLPPLPFPEIRESVTASLASVRAQSGLGTPDDWHVHHVLYQEAPQVADAAATMYVPVLNWVTNPPFVTPSSGASIRALRQQTDGLNPGYWAEPNIDNEFSCTDYGNQLGYHSEVSDMLVSGAAEVTDNPLESTIVVEDRIRFGVREAPENVHLAPRTPAVFALPHSVGPYDDLTVQVDGDADQRRFATQMYRRAKAADATYDSQIPLTDVDGGNSTFNATFGAGFSFDDFAVYMQARAKTHGADATRRILWRYYRHGADGNYVALRYMYPDAPDAELTTRVVESQETDVYVINPAGVPATRRINVDVVLGGGAAKTASNINPVSRLGVAATNPSAGGVTDFYALLGLAVVQGERLVIGGTTRLRLQVPNNGVVAEGPQSTGLSVNDVLWLEMNVPTATTSLSGAFVVLSVGAFNAGTGQVDVTLQGLNDGTSTWTLAANPGRVSFDPSSDTFFDPAIAVGDLFRLNRDDIPNWSNFTMPIVARGPQYLRARFPGDDVAINPTWFQLGDPTVVVVFGPPTQTAQEVADAVEALQGDESTTAVSATVTGSGSGVIDEATWQEFDTSNAHYDLTDGLNHVQRTIPGAGIGDDTQFLLKDPVNSDLSTNSDWANEDVRLAPIQVHGLVRWLNAPCVSGLFTSAEVTNGRDGEALQISTLTPGTDGSVEVQGGSANSATAAVQGSARLVTHSGTPQTMSITVTAAEAEAFVAGGFVRFDNTLGLSKTPFWDDLTEQLIEVDGTWSFTDTPYLVTTQANNVRVDVEVVGPYVAVRIPRDANEAAFFVDNFPADGYLYLCPATGAAVTELAALPDADQGVFRIIAVRADTEELVVWVENPNAVDGPYNCKLKALTSDSAVPGDLWKVNTTAFGVRNKQTWTITAVGLDSGEMYVQDSITVDTTVSVPQPLGVATPFGAAEFQVQLVQGAPARLYFRLLAVSPNQEDGSFADMHFDHSNGIASVGEAGGTVATMLDKLAFPLGVNLGVDGYAYDTGLLAEANRVLYGDEADRATYPGVVAHGADVLQAGPLVKRVSLALALRVQSGLMSDDLADRVRSAVATVVNSSPMGRPVSLGAVIAAAQGITGVVAASMVKPAFTSTSDVIPVAANERAKVLDLRADVSISFVGE